MRRRKGQLLRSSYEDLIKADLEARKISYQYESLKLPYIKECCTNCGHVTKKGTYHPDFIIGSLIVETKGRFVSTDRSKMIAVKKAHPDKDIRILFQVDDRIGKSPNKRGTKKEDKVNDKRTRYTEWCTKHGFPSAVGDSIPKEWIGDDVSTYAEGYKESLILQDMASHTEIIPYEDVKDRKSLVFSGKDWSSK